MKQLEKNDESDNYVKDIDVEETNFKTDLDIRKETIKEQKNGMIIKNKSMNRDYVLIENAELLYSKLTKEMEKLKKKKEEKEEEVFEMKKQSDALNVELAHVKDQIEELKHHEKDSLKSLDEKYDFTIKQIVLNQESRLNNLKDEVNRNIKKLVDESSTVNDNETKNLDKKIEFLLNEINYIKEEFKVSKKKLNEDFEKKKDLFDQEINDLTIRKNNENEILNQKTSSILMKIEFLCNEYEKFIITRDNDLLVCINDLNSQYKLKEFEKKNLDQTIDEKIDELKKCENMVNLNMHEIEKIQSNIEQLNNDLINQEQYVRYLENKSLELKGNIRVFCRIKPSLNEKDLLFHIESSCEDLNENANQELVIFKSKNTSPKSQYQFINFKNNFIYKFQFDKIFMPDLKNETIFEELSYLVQSTLNGCNVCVFVYGQTGSGKTYTMCESENGIISLSSKKIFEVTEKLKDKGWNYSINGQIIEIYNETIIDLLSANDSNTKHEIIHNDSDGDTFITNVTKIEISSHEKLLEIMDLATSNRSTLSTKLNERSSRSHFFLLLKLFGENNKTNEKFKGQLNFVDLAGSEKLSNYSLSVERIKETQSINKSLSCLKDVIFFLSQQNSNFNTNKHIPYRNSKLTYLLKNSLGGNSKTLMLVNISQLKKNFNETLNSLRFAAKVNTTKCCHQQKN